MATTLNVGQTLPLTIEYLDQSGQAMQATPTPDSPPQWSQMNSSVDTLTAAADGVTASASAVSAGDDTIRLQLSVGGQQFTATLDLSISGGVSTGQTLTSIGIVAGTPSP